MTDADDLLELAPLQGIDALAPDDAARIASLRERVSPQVRAEFDRMVSDTQEAMAVLSTATATAPPTRLRERILAEITAEITDRGQLPTSTTPTPPPAATIRMGGTARQRVGYLAAAALMAVAVGGVGWAIGSGLSSRSTPQISTTERVFTAQDVRTTTGDLAGGNAAVTYSDSADAAVLVMNDVPAPAAGTVYQMWLVGPQGATSAGTMGPTDVSASTTAVIPHIGDAQSLAFSVEPAGGATSPGTIVAELPLR